MRQGKGFSKLKALSPAEYYILAVVLGIVLAAGVMVLIEVSSGKSGGRGMPDFAAYTSVTDKKEAFFNYLLPYINEQNQTWMEERQRILALKNRFEEGKKLKGGDRKWLIEKYLEVGFDSGEIEDPDFFSHLLSRVDAIPPSLALAQAANESAWGTSRFAREGYNLYGIWCYQPGCGLVPRRRPAGATYEVTRYKSPGDSVTDYFRNLNTGTAYLPMRQIRQRLRESGRPITGIELANGLERYSERGMAYVRDIQNLIRSNNLSRYDQ